MSDKALWETCLESFEKSLPTQQFNSWIKPLACEIKGDVITLIAPNTFILKIIQDRFLDEILSLAKSKFKSTPKLEFKLSKKLISPNVLEANVTIPVEKIDLEKSKTPRNHSKLNGSLAFENFVTGKANQLAHAAAMQVANFPGTMYNPLFIYGGVGLGKTHLLQSIGNLVKNENPLAKICYVHATNYVSDVVRAFQTKKFDEFKQFYNSLDLLLIDDIQFIADKPGTQQEFFYTLNSLIDSNKQVVITCDTFPKEISGIEARLTSRFSCGLTVAVEPPGLEMRVAILLADFYRLKVVELLSKKRTRAIARPRQVAMCLARELTQLSLPEIGNAFGGRDHSTVLHACKTVETLRNSDQTFNSDFNLLNQTLRN
jgi:chromosomal replication initiator protein